MSTLGSVHRKVASIFITVCTICTSLLLLIFVGGASAAQTVVDEAALLGRLMAHGVVAATHRVAHAERVAARTVPSALPTPRLALRREASFGDNIGFVTTVLGLEADLDISGRPQIVREVGARAVEASRLSRAAALVDAACRLRVEALDVRAADERVAVLDASHAELVVLGTEVNRLVEGRERAAFDAERVALRVRRHHRELAVARARRDAAQAVLTAWIGPLDGPISVDPATPPREAGWLERAVEHSPHLAVLRAQMGRIEVERTLGERWWVPGIGVYGAWRHDAPTGSDAGHGYEAGLTVDLPIEDRGAPTRAQADAARERIAAELLRVETRLRVRLVGLAAELTGLEALPEPPSSATHFTDRAKRRYRGGVGPLAELFETLDFMEADALARVERAAHLRSLRLAMACAAGRFAEPELQTLLERGLESFKGEMP